MASATVPNSTAFSILGRLQYMMNGSMRWSSGVSARSSIPDDAGSCSSVDSLSWTAGDLLRTEEEAAAVTNEKGSLLMRIDRLEEHVMMLEEKLQLRKKSREGKRARRLERKIYEIRKKNRIPCLELEHLKKQIRLNRYPAVADTKCEEEEKEERKSILDKILQPGFLLPPTKGCFFPTRITQRIHDRGEKKGQKQYAESMIHAMKDKSKEDTSINLKKRRPPFAVSVMPSKSKNSRELEVECDRMFSLQGIQSYSTWDMRHARYV